MLDTVCMTLIYDDTRYGDRYEVELTPQGDFLYALRFVDRIGSDPIHYCHLREIPVAHQHQIANLIHGVKYAKNRTN